MCYSDVFKNLISRVSECDSANLGFVGTGNPEANILFVDNVCESEHAASRMATNARQWKTLIDGGVPDYDPRCAHQDALCERVRAKDIDDCEHMPSWLCYQMLVDGIRESQYSGVDYAEFLNIAFVTQLCCDDDSQDDAAASVDERCRHLLCDDFFRRFPIVVMNSGTFVKDYGVSVTKVFGQRYRATKRYDDGWIKVYENDGRLLLVTDFMPLRRITFVLKIAREIKRFVERDCLKYCLYYDGTRNDNGSSIFAFYEKCWIWSSFFYDGYFDEDVRFMLRMGVPEQWLDSMGVPRTLPALFLNRYMHWTTSDRFRAEAFMNWFERIRKKRG